MKALAVMNFIQENFETDKVTITDFPLFPYGKKVTDKNGDEMVVFYDLLFDRVKWVFPDRQTKNRQAVEYIGKVNLYEKDKISFDSNEHIQEWYGMKQGKEKLVCAQCGGTYESKGIAAIHGDNMLELIYKCECGNIMISRTYRK